jgi:hypothetical protein
MLEVPLHVDGLAGQGSRAKAAVIGSDSGVRLELDIKDLCGDPFASVSRRHWSVDDFRDLLVDGVALMQQSGQLR